MSVMGHNQSFTGYAQLIISILFILGLSCQPSGTFVPQPRKTEKQEVRLLATGEKAPDFRLPDINGKYY
jgi:hypothetical protein